MNRVLKFIKKNISSFICFLMAIIVALTATLSYARYVTDGKFNGASSIGSFSCSAAINGVSAVSFTNTAFWGGTAEDDRNDIAMNALRSLYFSVNNFDIIDGKKVINEVKTRYTLIFTTPETFAERLAIQLFNGDGGAPMLPQILLSDIVDNADKTFNTGASDNFNGDESIDDVSFSVVHSSNKYIATHDPDVSIAGDETVITMTEEILPLEQTLYFRLWDVSKITNEQRKTVSSEIGNLLAPMCVTYSEDVACYKISISMPEFVHSAGIEETHNYSLTLAPTSALNDEHLGGYPINTASNDNSTISTIATGDLLTLQTITEYVTDSDKPEDAYTPKTVLGGLKVYNVGDSETKETIKPVEFDITETSESVENRYNTLYVYYMYDEDTDRYTYSTSTTNYRLILYDVESSTTTKTEIEASALESVRTTEEIGSVSVDGTTVTLEIVKTTSKEYIDVEGTQTVTEITTYSYSSYTAQSYYRWGWYNDNKFEPNKADTIFDNDNHTIQLPSVITTEPVSSLEGESETTSFTRTIRRVYNEAVTLTATNVTRNITDSSGNIDTVSYPAGSPFKFYGENEIQKFFISQCYSKNYPLTVNVLFEQTSN